MYNGRLYFYVALNECLTHHKFQSFITFVLSQKDESQLKFILKKINYSVDAMITYQ